MDKLYKPSYLKEVLARHDFEFSKALGQNFLIDGNIVRAIVEGSGLEERDLVIEIGPGAGTLTQELEELSGKVIAVELDSSLMPILEETTGPKVQLINADALDLDFNQLIEEAGDFPAVRLIANLPYNVGTKIVAQLLEDRVPLDSMTIMLQKEVADRMMAQPGDSQYGSISLLVDYFTDFVDLVAKVPRSVFIPQPKIASQVIRLDIKEVEEPPYEKAMFKMIRGAFTQRRKTILNSLLVGTDLTKEDLVRILDREGIDSNLRAGDLSIGDYKRIARNL